MKTPIRTLAGPAALAAALLLGACATSANREAMVAEAPAAGARQHPFSVSVATAGGAETGAMDSSNIANADLQASIEDSIKRSRLFAEVVQGKGGQYLLAVSVTQLAKPMFGLSFTVDMEAAWSLTKTDGQQVVFRKVIKSSHTAGMGDAFAGVTRLRLAVEGAARANIQQGLAEIRTLAL